MKNFKTLIMGILIGVTLTSVVSYAMSVEDMQREQDRQTLNRIEQNQIYNEVSKDRINAGIGLPETPCR